MLGAMYAVGQGVTMNFKEAVAWYRKAAAQGNARTAEAISLLDGL